MPERAGPRVFFYGTLSDAEVRRALLGPRSDALVRVPALLPGFRRVRARSANYPMLVRSAGGRVDGEAATGFDKAMLAAIAFYEGPLYEPCPVRVALPGGRQGEAWIFLARSRVLAGHGTWDEARWRQRDKARLIRDARRWKAELDLRGWVPHEVPWRVRRRIEEMFG